MALVVFIRGVNVGGHKTFRPTLLAEQLKQFDAVNMRAAGTFVVRKSVSRARLRAEVTRRLPFDACIVICQGREILRLMTQNPFGDLRAGRGTVHFVSVLVQRPRLKPAMPITFPSNGRWLVTIVARKDRFIFGMYRRHMKTIGYLGMIDRLFGVPVTTRNWNTVKAIAELLTTGA